MSAVGMPSAASMNNLEAETLRQRQKWTRRWYLLVIVLLYIGLLASFSLNVSLLLRKPSPLTSAESPLPENSLLDGLNNGSENPLESNQGKVSVTHDAKKDTLYVLET